MNRSKTCIFFAVLSILLFNHNVSGSSLNKRTKRMSQSSSDTGNFFKHDIFLTTQNGTCSGSIISDRFVLTAAHCVVVKNTNKFIGIDQKPMIVVAGITKLFNFQEFQVIRLVKKIYIPREYNNIANSDDDYERRIGDIAVLELNYRLGLGKDPRLDIINLPTHEFKFNVNNPQQPIWFAGYGLINAVFDHSTGNYLPGVYPSHLQFSKAIVLQPYECDYLGNTKLKMCAKLETEGTGICGGDSGGALFNFYENTIIGVLSYGDVAKCSGSVPGKYTQVFPYLEFIMNAVNNVLDKRMIVKSYEGDYAYNYALKDYPSYYQYYWIYDSVY